LPTGTRKTKIALNGSSSGLSRSVHSSPPNQTKLTKSKYPGDWEQTSLLGSPESPESREPPAHPAHLLPKINIAPHLSPTTTSPPGLPGHPSCPATPASVYTSLTNSPRSIHSQHFMFPDDSPGGQYSPGQYSVKYSPVGENNSTGQFFQYNSSPYTRPISTEGCSGFVYTRTISTEGCSSSVNTRPISTEMYSSYCSLSPDDSTQDHPEAETIRRAQPRTEGSSRTEGISSSRTEGLSRSGGISSSRTDCISSSRTEGVSSSRTEGVSSSRTDCISSSRTEGVSSSLSLPLFSSSLTTSKLSLHSTPPSNLNQAQGLTPS